MSTIRQRAKAAEKPKLEKKKVVKPVLTNPHIIQWPQVSQPAQAQIEASLWQLLTPLVSAREHQYERAANDTPLEPTPLASTSKLVDEAPASNAEESPMETRIPTLEDENVPEQSDSVNAAEEMSAVTAQPKMSLSKRAKHREYLRKKIEKRDEHLEPGTHELSLRSGKSIQVPDRQQPERFLRKLRLDKHKALDTRPAICDAMVIGLNAVTRYLEDIIDSRRRQLAGLPPVAQTSALTAKDNLRLFIPTPNRGTRRDRRALKERLHPKSKTEKLKGKRNQVLDTLPDMPPNLVVPRNEPALVFAMEDVRSRLEKAIRTPAEDSSLFAIERILPLLKRDTTEATEHLGEVDMTSTNTVPKQAGEPTEVPTDLIIGLLFSSSRSIDEDRDRSILLSLFSRFDPEWFRLWNMRRQAMSKLGQINKLSAQVEVVAEKSIPTITRRTMQLIFVAKGDINPLHIVQHLLTAVAAHNSLNLATQVAEDDKKDSASDYASAHGDIYLVPLSKGAEQKLAGLLALRRVSVLAFSENDSPEYNKLAELVKTHLPMPLSAEWLIPAVNGLAQHSAQPGNLVPTHVKHLQTIMPVDIKALRAEKLSEKKRKREEARNKAETDKECKKARLDESDTGQT